MKRGESPKLETLEALIAEKRKHEGYLAKLDERREGTPEHVFSRLRDEYLTKLTDAQVRATAEAESLADSLADDEQAVSEAEERLAALAEERMEGELRAAVGEYDQKEWQKKLSTLNASIALAEKERDARSSGHERLRSLLAEARGGLEPGDDRAHVPPAPEGPSAPTPATNAKLRATAAINGGPKFDELAFLNSVVPRASTPPSRHGGDTAPKPIREGGSAAPPPRGAAMPTPAAPVDRARLTPAEARVVPPSPVPAPELPLVAQPEVPDPGPAPAPAAQPAAPAAPAARTSQPVSKSVARPPVPTAAEEDEEVEPSVLGRPTPRTSQAIKTLKCAECGSMNYPTEWYCERCGGELAAL